MPAVKELPSTIMRSPKKAQNTWIKAHDSAVKEYGEGRRAHMTAFAALKHSFEKIGDHWESKQAKGPSDKGATDRSGRTAQGVDANASKEHLQKVAKKLGVTGRSSMTKQELVGAIKKANRKATSKSAPKTMAKSSSTPSTKAAAKSSSRPTTKAAAKTTSKPTTKAAAKSSSRPTAKSTVKSAPKTMAKTSSKPTAKAAAKSSSRPSTKAAAKSSSRPTAKSTMKSSSRPTPKAMPKTKTRATTKSR